MEAAERAHGSRRVRVRYETRGYGLALTIVDDLDGIDGGRGRGGAGAIAVAGPTYRRGRRCRRDGGAATGSIVDVREVRMEPEGEIDDGVLTVGDTGVTTLEFRRGDGETSFLIWDAAEVDWDSLRAG